MKTTLAVQYLEPDAEKVGLAPGAVRDRLQAALQQLPIAFVLLGWNLPTPLIDACRDVCTRAGVKLFLWHPLLTGDGVLQPRPAWQTIGVQGEPVPGFQDMPEFTFVCPNRPAVREAVLQCLEQIVAGGLYDGIFLDRIRFPSPTGDPARWLACFCDDCRKAAAVYGLDLEDVRRALWRLTDPQRVGSLLQGLLGGPEDHDPHWRLLDAFLDFRSASVHDIVRAVAGKARSAGLGVGLDCFSPTLARAVGQDLGALMGCADWIKVMTYAHTLGPAGLPFELLGLVDWLVHRYGLSDTAALERISQAAQFPLPSTRAALHDYGLASSALGSEIRRARSAGVASLWAGIEMVEIPGVCHLEKAQFARDLAAVNATSIDGLVLSWDLWNIPDERLRWIAV